MPFYDVEVWETVKRKQEYRVEAANRDEALEKAADGETEHETTIRGSESVERTVDRYTIALVLVEGRE